MVYQHGKYRSFWEFKVTTPLLKDLEFSNNNVNQYLYFI